MHVLKLNTPTAADPGPLDLHTCKTAPWLPYENGKIIGNNGTIAKNGLLRPRPFTNRSICADRWGDNRHRPFRGLGTRLDCGQAHLGDHHAVDKFPDLFLAHAVEELDTTDRVDPDHKRTEYGTFEKLLLADVARVKLL